MLIQVSTLDETKGPRADRQTDGGGVLSEDNVKMLEHLYFVNCK